MPQKILKANFRFYLPAIIWFITCCILFTLPGSAFPKKNWFNIIWFDKWVHIGLIGLLILLSCWGFYRANNRQLKSITIIKLIAAASVYGLLIEFIQLYFVSNRSFDGGDVVADVIGAVLAGLFAAWRWAKK